MQINRRKKESVVILDLDGRLDIPGAALLKHTVKEEFDQGSRLFALNFAKVAYIGKDTVGAIVSINQMITRAEGKMVIFSPHWDVKEYVETFSYKISVKIAEDEAQALKAFGIDASPVNAGPVYLALGTSDAFKELFWTVKKLGGVPMERFEKTAQAGETLANNRVDVVLLDALMPLNGAIEAVKELKLKACCKQSVFFLIGPDSTRAIYNIAHQYGAHDFVPVPYEREELVSSIDKGQFFELLRRKFELWAEGYYTKK